MQELLEASSTLVERWQKDGYLVLPSVFDADRIAALRSICEAAFEQWKRGSKREVEPGEYAYGPTAWSMMHLNHPRYHQKTPGSLATLLGTIAYPPLIPLLRELLHDEPFFCQANYYINPYGETRRGPWHRDSQFFTAGDEDAERRDIFTEADPPRELHMHIPLVPTAASEVVPGSHNRWDTAEENRVRRKEAFSENMPGATTLRLNPGDVAFFHVNAIHRGLYHPETLRRTIAVTWTTTARHRPCTREWIAQWKGYIAHYQPWFLRPDYLDGLPDESRRLYETGIATMREEWQQPDMLDDLTPERRSYFHDAVETV